MKFNHLIQINDPLLPLADPLTRLQLWRGLVLRAQQQQLFMPHLDDCQLEGQDPVRRALRFGALTVNDVVSFEPLSHVHYDVPPQGEIAASSLRMTIEEPQPQILFVRFEYTDAQPDPAPGSEEAKYDDFRRSAYSEADIDTIRVIRELAADGQLD